MYTDAELELLELNDKIAPIEQVVAVDVKLTKNQENPRKLIYYSQDIGPSLLPPHGEKYIYFFLYFFPCWAALCGPLLHPCMGTLVGWAGPGQELFSRCRPPGRLV